MARTTKTLGVAASLTGVALSLGVPSAAAAPTAKPTPVDPDGYTLSCSQVTGSISFSPHLKIEAAAGTITEKWKMDLGGCVAGSPAGGAPVVVSKGTMAGIIVVADQGCTGVLAGGGAQGMLTAKWKVAPGTAKIDRQVHHLGPELGTRFGGPGGQLFIAARGHPDRRLLRG